MYIPSDKIFPFDPKFLVLWPLTFTFKLLFNNFNLGHNYWTVRAAAFIFHMYIPFDMIFQLVPKFLPCDMSSISAVLTIYTYPHRRASSPTGGSCYEIWTNLKILNTFWFLVNTPCPLPPPPHSSQSPWHRSLGIQVAHPIPSPSLDTDPLGSQVA